VRHKPSSADAQSLTRAVATLAPVNMVVQVLSFGSSIALATQLGAGTGTDAYYLALSVAAIANGILLVAVQSGAIPVLTPYAKTDAGFARGCNELVSATLVGGTLISLIVTAVMMVILPLAAGGSARLQLLTREFMLELLPFAVTGAVQGALGAILAVRGRFVVTSFVLVFEPILKSILVLLFHRQLGAQALVIGNVAGNLLAIIVLWGILRSDGVPLHLVSFRSSPIIGGLVRLSAPLVVSTSVLQVNPLIDRATAASLGAGDVTVLSLGIRFYTAPTALLTTSLLLPLTATWSARLAAHGWDAVVRSFLRAVLLVVLVLPPIVVVGFVLRHEIVDIAYRSQAYTPDAVSNTADVLGMLLLGLIPQVLIIPLSTLFVIRRDGVFPMKVGIANVVLNAVLDIVLRDPFGVAGIALGTTLTHTILCAAYLREAERRWGSLHLRSLVRPLTVSLASALVLCVLAAWILGLSPSGHSRTQEFAVAIAAVGAAAVIHITLMILTRTPERAGLRLPVVRPRRGRRLPFTASRSEWQANSPP
jgi:putative peptidoglycan lipid II flippase